MSFSSSATMRSNAFSFFTFVLAKVNVLTDDLNQKVATIDPLFTAVADLSESVSDLNDQARQLSVKAVSAGGKTVKASIGLKAIKMASKLFK